MVWFSVLLKFGMAAHDLPARLDQIDAAKTFLRQTGLIARSQHRNRLPNANEHQRIIEYLTTKDKRRTIPMTEILTFAMHSARRLSEITRVKWEDLDTEHNTILIRDLKHPRQKTGNHQRAKLTPEAMAVIMRQPRTAEEIFPYNPRTISAYFTQACKILEIPDLHFHDYRHLATTWLFICGHEIQNVATITLHESWDMLKRYTHLDELVKQQVLKLYAVAATSSTV